jgi:hypothetical protein
VFSLEVFDKETSMVFPKGAQDKHHMTKNIKKIQIHPKNKNKILRC